MIFRGDTVIQFKRRAWRRTFHQCARLLQVLQTEQTWNEKSRRFQFRRRGWKAGNGKANAWRFESPSLRSPQSGSLTWRRLHRSKVPERRSRPATHVLCAKTPVKDSQLTLLAYEDRRASRSPNPYSPERWGFYNTYKSEVGRRR